MLRSINLYNYVNRNKSVDFLLLLLFIYARYLHCSLIPIQKINEDFEYLFILRRFELNVKGD